MLAVYAMLPAPSLALLGNGMVEHAIHSPWDTDLLDLQCANDLVATLNTHIASAQQLLCYCASPLWAAVYIGGHQVALPSLLCCLHITIYTQKRRKEKRNARGLRHLCSCYLYTEHGRENATRYLHYPSGFQSRF